MMRKGRISPELTFVVVPRAAVALGIALTTAAALIVELLTAEVRVGGREIKYDTGATV